MKVCPVCQRCFEDEILSCSEENHEPLIEGRAGSREIIANYRLGLLCESSAMGETYLAINTSLEKTRLVRIIAPELFGDDQNIPELFLGEARKLSAIFQPNVARVYESGTLADGSLYVVTEFFTEETLRNCLDETAVTEVTALTITRQAAEGLDALHTLSVLHRNIRPENIILTSDAEHRLLVKIQNIDFGGIRQKIVTSRMGQNLSALRYFSPEQCAGQPIEMQTDVYSLGIVLYETLTGQPPFDATDADVLINKHINETPPPVNIKNFDIRALLTHTLTDALQKTARLRLKTANIFARRIRHIEQIATHSPTPPPAMSYPLEMNKQAVVFTPPPKVENPVPVLVENQIIIENPVPIENEIVFEETSSVEETAIENPTPIENEIVVEIPSPIESQVENLTPIKDEMVFETPALIKYEMIVENPTPVKDQLIAEEDKLPVQTFVDLTTNKLPPIELLIENSLSENDLEIPTTATFDAPENSEIQITAEPALIEWEQPDDIPPMPINPEIEERETEFALAEDIIDYGDSVIDADELDSQVDYLPEVYEIRRDYAAERPVFSYNDSGISRNFPEKRKVLIGAGIAALFVLMVGGTLLSRQFQLEDDARQTIVQSSSGEKSLPKPTQTEKVSENDNPSEVKENISSADADNSETPDLPVYQPRDIEEKKRIPISQPRNQKRVVKAPAENRSKPMPNKPVSSEVLSDKKAESATNDKKIADETESPKEADTSTLTRPRVVKNPKSSRIIP